MAQCLQSRALQLIFPSPLVTYSPPSPCHVTLLKPACLHVASLNSKDPPLSPYISNFIKINLSFWRLPLFLFLCFILPLDQYYYCVILKIVYYSMATWWMISALHKPRNTIRSLYFLLIIFHLDNVESFVQIIAPGFLLCSGSSLFLFKHMTLIINEPKHS